MAGKGDVVKRAKEFEKKGDGCMKTGMFNWSKDLAGAATNYDSAAQLYFDNAHYPQAGYG